MASIRRVARPLTARPWLSAVAVVVVAGGVIGYVLLTGGSDSSSASAATTSRLVDVSTGTVNKSVSTSGDLEPAVDKQVSFAAGATITSVRVSVGAKVTKGQILGTVDDLSLKSSLAQERSTLASARASLSSAENSDGITSTQLTADKAQVTTARRAVTSARESLADAVLRSPVSGTVAAVNVSKGDQSVGSSGGSGAAGSTAAGGTATTSDTSSSGDFEIIGTSSWKVSVDVDDTEIGLIDKGQQAQLTTDNHTGTIFGTVTSVSVLSSSTSGAASYPVTVTVTGSQSGLHDGAEATVKIVYKQATNVVTVPSAALNRDGSSTYVYLSANGRKTKQTVRTGLTDGTTTQITSGLKSGEQVYESITTPGGGSGGGTQPTGTLPSGFPTGGFPSGFTRNGGGFPGGAGGSGGGGS